MSCCATCCNKPLFWFMSSPTLRANRCSTGVRCFSSRKKHFFQNLGNSQKSVNWSIRVLKCLLCMMMEPISCMTIRYAPKDYSVIRPSPRLYKGVTHRLLKRSPGRAQNMTGNNNVLMSWRSCRPYAYAARINFLNSAWRISANET